MRVRIRVRVRVLSWPSAPRTHSGTRSAHAQHPPRPQPQASAAISRAKAAPVKGSVGAGGVGRWWCAPQMRCAGSPGRPRTPAAHSYQAPASSCRPPCARAARAAWAWWGVGASEVHSQRVVVVGGRRSSRVGAPNELAVLDDAPQLGQDGLPHVHCATHTMKPARQQGQAQVSPRPHHRRRHLPTPPPPPPPPPRPPPSPPLPSPPPPSPPPPGQGAPSLRIIVSFL